MNPDIPARLLMEPTTAGKHAEHFMAYSTAQLIDLFRQMLPLGDEDEAAAEARARGEASHLDVLVALHERGNKEVFDAAVELCRHPSPEERVMGLRILGELEPYGPRPVFRETTRISSGDSLQSSWAAARTTLKSSQCSFGWRRTHVTT